MKEHSQILLNSDLLKFKTKTKTTVEHNIYVIFSSVKVQNWMFQILCTHTHQGALRPFYVRTVGKNTGEPTGEKTRAYNKVILFTFTFMHIDIYSFSSYHPK